VGLSVGVNVGVIVGVNVGVVVGVNEGVIVGVNEGVIVGVNEGVVVRVGILEFDSGSPFPPLVSTSYPIFVKVVREVIQAKIQVFDFEHD